MLDELSDLTDEISEELSGVGDDSDDAEKAERLGIGEYELVEAPDRLSCHGLGSCIGIFLYDPTSGVGAGVHALLPRRGEDDDIDADDEDDKQPTRYTDHAVTVLYEELTHHPSVNEDAVIAKLTGGSEMLRFVTLSTDVGSRNVTAARETLEELGVEIEGEDVGGEEGRIVEFDPSTGGLIVRKANGEQKVI